MPIDITFTLSDHDLDRFQAVIDKAKLTVVDNTSPEEIVAAACKLIEEARSAALPEYIANRLLRLQVIINMLGDTEWQLGDEDRARVVGALTYFCAPEDVIPDSVPGLGYLYDAIYVELILRELNAEVTSFEEFCKFRTAEENRRREQGLDPRVDRDAWLADKRATLLSGMSKRRKGSKRWRLRW